MNTENVEKFQICFDPVASLLNTSSTELFSFTFSNRVITVPLSVAITVSPVFQVIFASDSSFTQFNFDFPEEDNALQTYIEIELSRKNVKNVGECVMKIASVLHNKDGLLWIKELESGEMSISDCNQCIYNGIITQTAVNAIASNFSKFLLQDLSLLSIKNMIRILKCPNLVLSNEECLIKLIFLYFSNKNPGYRDLLGLVKTQYLTKGVAQAFLSLIDPRHMSDEEFRILLDAKANSNSQKQPGATNRHIEPYSRNSKSNYQYTNPLSYIHELPYHSGNFGIFSFLLSKGIPKNLGDANLLNPPNDYSYVPQKKSFSFTIDMQESSILLYEYIIIPNSISTEQISWTIEGISNNHSNVIHSQNSVSIPMNGLLAKCNSHQYYSKYIISFESQMECTIPFHRIEFFGVLDWSTK